VNDKNGTRGLHTYIFVNDISDRNSYMARARARMKRRRSLYAAISLNETWRTDIIGHTCNFVCEDERGVTESRGEERRLRCVREGDYSVVKRTRSEEIFAVGFAVMRDRPRVPGEF